MAITIGTAQTWAINVISYIFKSILNFTENYSEEARSDTLIICGKKLS